MFGGNALSDPSNESKKKRERLNADKEENQHLYEFRNIPSALVDIVLLRQPVNGMLMIWYRALGNHVCDVKHKRILESLYILIARKDLSYYSNAHHLEAGPGVDRNIGLPDYSQPR